MITCYRQKGWLASISNSSSPVGLTSPARGVASERTVVSITQASCCAGGTNNGSASVFSLAACRCSTGQLRKLRQHQRQQWHATSSDRSTQWRQTAAAADLAWRVLALAVAQGGASAVPAAPTPHATPVIYDGKQMKRQQKRVWFVYLFSLVNVAFGLCAIWHWHRHRHQLRHQCRQRQHHSARNICERQP